jgi:hypothetical protein
MMGWLYLMVCMFDFVFFPILWSLIQALGHGQVNMQWQPITLQGAGLFHISMGAILGIAVYGRTKEKLNNTNLNSFNPINQNLTTESDISRLNKLVPTGNYRNSQVGNFDNNTTLAKEGYGQVIIGFNGYPAPIEPSREWI